MKNTVSRRRSRPTFRPRLESLETRLTPTTYTVSSLADSGTGSLRAAITSVNGDTIPDVIDFSVAGVIQLASTALPPIANTVKIDGTTAPGFAGAPVVEIDNHGFPGLIFNGASNSSLAGLSIVNADGAGVTFDGTLSDGFDSGTGFNITVVGNYIGLALDGSVAANSGFGLQTINAEGATIGGTAPVDRNVISGNGAGGIQIVFGASQEEFGPEGATIQGNFIGTDPTGKAAAGNQGNGITISGITSNAIGGTAAGAGNIIAFNSRSGVAMDSANVILSNSIFSNGFAGINFRNGASLPTPQLSYALESPGTTTGMVQIKIGGVLNTAAFGVFPSTIQVFATLNGMPAGQGQLFLGSVQVTPKANGFSKFTFSASVPAGNETTFTTTATLAQSATSGFSVPFAIGGSTNMLFVASAYELLLNRYPDPGTVSWVDLMNNGDSAAGVVLGIEGSTEYLSYQVTAMYKHYLQRSPDTAGEQAWTNFLVAGGTLEQLAEGLVSSQEYYVLQGGTDQGFITGLYRDVLQRNPTTEDLASWETALDAGVSRANVAVFFLTSQEYRADLVQNDYVTYLLRTADAGGVSAWVDALNAGASDQQVLAQIFGSPEGYQVWS